MVSRRSLLAAAGAGVALGLPGSAAIARSRTPDGTWQVTFTDRVTPVDVGRYRYYPFAVGEGVARVAASLDDGGASLGFGVFDERGPQYGSAGFRGVYGAELSSFFLSASDASRSFLPGPVRPGTWTLVVPVFAVSEPTEITIEVTLTPGRPGRPPFRAAPAPRVVRGRPGWYRGDLHCHTQQSSDAFASGSALSVAGWGETCRRIGLDFAAMTDHNVVAQNLDLSDAAGRGVLLMPGEEMTNWFHGHATVSGFDVGDWVDWRQRPQGLPILEHERRITAFTSAARELGAYTSAAHPLFPFQGLRWDFFAEAETDPAALPDGLELWTGPFFVEQGLDVWDGYLRRGWRVTANGGSDLHGTENELGFQPGQPTTVVYAEQLSSEAIVAALRGGRCFVTRAPDGGEVYLSAAGPGGQQAIVGGTVHGDPTDEVVVTALVRRGPLLADASGLRLILLRDGVRASVTPITRDEQAVVLHTPVGAGGYVRAELRGATQPNPFDPSLPGADMEALTNPVWISSGPPPADRAPEMAPSGPPRRGRRCGPAPLPTMSGAAAVALLGPDGHRH